MSSDALTGPSGGYAATSPRDVTVWRREALFIGILLVSLSDIYFPSLGLPVVPLIGCAVLVWTTLKWPGLDTPQSRARARNTALIALILMAVYCGSVLWGVLAFASGSAKAAFGMAVGTIILAVSLMHEENEEYRKAVLVCCTRVLMFHLAFWLVQFIIYLITKDFLDYLKPITGVPTRHTIGAEGVEVRLDRCTGLYAEPSIYVTNIYFLVSVRLIRSGLKIRWLDAVALLSMIASLALTGIVLALFTIVVCSVRWIRSWKAVTAVILVLIGAATAASAFTSTDIMLVLLARLDAPSTDPSGRLRTVDALTTFTQLPESAQILGIGVGNTDMVDKVSNGVVDLLISFGVIGVCVVVVLFVLMMRQRKVTPLFWVFLCGMMPGGPYSTILMWWLWFAMMVFAGTERRREATLEAGGAAG